MCLAIAAAASLDALEGVVRIAFGYGVDTGGGVANPTGHPSAGGEAEAAAAARKLVADAARLAKTSGPEHPWSGTSPWPCKLCICPVKEKRAVTVTWPMPSAAADIASHDIAGCDTDPHGQIVSAELRLAYRRQNILGRADGMRRMVGILHR